MNGAWCVTKEQRVAAADPNAPTPLRVWLILAASEFFILTGSLTVGGFQALLPTLLDEGKFSDLCPDGERTCDRQHVALSTMMVIAGIACNFVLLPGGWFHDRYGPRLYGIVGGVSLALGGLMLGALQQWALLFLAYGLISIGNVILFFSLVHMANLLPARRGTIVSVFRVSEPFSVAVFIAFNALYQAGQVDSLLTLFVWYLPIPLGFVVFCWLCQPNEPYTVVGEPPVPTVVVGHALAETHEKHVEQTALIPDNPLNPTRSDTESMSETIVPVMHGQCTTYQKGAVPIPEEPTRHHDNNDVALLPRAQRPSSLTAGCDDCKVADTARKQESYFSTQLDWRQQLGTVEFGFYAVWSAVAISFTWLFEGTLQKQLTMMHDASHGQAVQGGHVFSYWYMFGPLLAIPFGRVLDRAGSPAGFACVGGLFALQLVPLMFAPFQAQFWSTFPLYVVSRSCLFAVWTHFGNVAGGKTMGLFVGFASLITAVVMTSDIMLVHVMVNDDAFEPVLGAVLSLSVVLSFVLAFCLSKRRIT